MKHRCTLLRKCPLLHYTSQLPPADTVLSIVGLGTMTGCFLEALSNFMNINVKKREALSLSVLL